MIEVKGKYNTATIYTDNIEEAAYSQVLNLMNQKFAEGSKFAIMPDCHAGAGCVIGLTMTLVDRVVPNLVGVDIGCGMFVVKLDKSFKMDLNKMDEICHNEIPSGMNIRNNPHNFASLCQLDELIAPINIDRIRKSVGTLGGGNHFIEVDVDDEGSYYIVIHSGSRHLGVDVCKYYQKLAVFHHRDNNWDRLALIESLKAQGRQNEIEMELKKLSDGQVKVPDELAYLVGDDMKNYLHDMRIAQDYAMYNRSAMMKTIFNSMNISCTYVRESFNTIHNYIDLRHNILRKGAISLEKDETAIIPMNMRDGSLIVRGKGNPEWNFSGPHGAGRLMSRSKAKESLSVDEFRQSMDGIFTTCVGKSTIDESPMAYKPMDEIIRNIQDTAEVVKIIKPVYNFKAAE